VIGSVGPSPAAVVYAVVRLVFADCVVPSPAWLAPVSVIEAVPVSVVVGNVPMSPEIFASRQHERGRSDCGDERAACRERATAWALAGFGGQDVLRPQRRSRPQGGVPVRVSMPMSRAVRRHADSSTRSGHGRTKECTRA
jgi:hypothetical protein